MRLAISNIAWDVAEDDAVATLLQANAIDAIDIAPGKYFPQPAQATPADIERVRKAWLARGVEITGMQSLLFGTSGLNLFAASDVQQAMLAHLAAVCRIAGELQATRLVFGSPRNRDRVNLDDAGALRIATDFFRRLGDIAAQHGVCICLEPNPPRYGANFMTTSAETAQVVRAVAHPAIRMQLDTGAVTINSEDIVALLADCAPLIGHVHASEPDLLPLGDGGCEHARIASALRRYGNDRLVSIEMLATRGEPHTAAIARAMAVAHRHYRETTA